MSDEISEKVTSVVASVKRIPPAAVSIQSTFEQLGIDSLDAIDIMFKLEDTFNISIPDEQAKSIRSVWEMVDDVRKLAGDGARNGSTRLE